jgi:hypothetical protein
MKLYTEIKHKSTLVCNVLKNNNEKCNYKAKYITCDKNSCCGKHLEKSLSQYMKAKDTECAICFTKIQAKMLYRLPCEHIFHEDCIKKWIIEQNSCPLCRKVVDENKTNSLPENRRMSVQISFLISRNLSSNVSEETEFTDFDQQEILSNIENQILQLEEFIDTSDIQSIDNATVNDILSYLEDTF